jgi:hypothetical protein
MKDLYRCLDEYPEDLLLAIAGAWGVALPRGDAMRMVKRLGDEMLSPGAIAPALAGLSPPAQEALAYLAAQGGAAPARPTALRYGALRRFGPARLRREKPWLDPTGPLEELYYRGLVYRAYGQLGDYYGDLFLIPDELAALLPPMQAPSAVGQTALGAEPERALSAGAALLEDLLALIVLLRRQPLPWPADATPSTEALVAWAQGARLLGGADQGRLQMLWRLLARQELAEHDGRYWRLALGARQWLRQRDAEQWLETFTAWRDDAGWDELLHLPTILCEQAGWQNQPARARRRLCAILAAFAPGVWYDLESLLQALRDQHPDYLRPDGDLDSWLIRDAQSGEYLRGLDSWVAVEGALARHLLAGPLHWLGVTDLGMEGETGSVVALRLTSAGKRLLAGLAPETPAPAASEPPAQIDEQMLVRIATRDTRYLRYQLERLAVWQAQDDGEARYLLSEDAVWQGLNTGIQGEQIQAFLRRIAGDALPPSVERTLGAWAGRFGRVSLGRAVVLETLDEATMQEIRQGSELAALLGESLGPTRCLVSDEHLDELVARLKQRDIWPRLKR